MASNATFARVAALAGDPARAGMLHALMDGRALTASELASVACITAQTASSHLARMTEAGLLTVEKQGRHRYHRLASPDVARMMETIMQVASTLEPARRVSVGPRDVALRAARTCYDPRRPARRGAMDTGGQGYPELASDGGIITDAGAVFGRIGIDVRGALARRGKRSPVFWPALPGLERAAAASGRSYRGGAVRAQSREDVGAQA
jgi:DNA-binding transcriptional ArsR family regulator